jgi:DNA sulfur modification protein DndE
MKFYQGIISFRTALTALLIFAFSTLAPCSDDIKSEIKKHTEGVPFVFDEITPPAFPEKYFNIKDFGAIGNGEHKNTNSINNAIKECSASGGGHVIIPAGLWITGPVKLMSNVDLHLERGAVVAFSKDHADFEMISPSGGTFVCESPLSGYDLTNISISGEGLFDGNGDTWRPVKKSKMTEPQWKKLKSSGGALSKDESIWWPSEQALNAETYLAGKNKKELTKQDYENVKDFLRPNMLQLVNCSQVMLDGFTLQNSPKFHLNANKCKNMIIRNVTVMTDWWAQNGDGLDISACKNVLMYNCTVNAGDDGICLKSSRVKGESYALENIIVSECVVYHAHGGFVIGSNTDGGLKNVYVKNCSFIGTDTGLRFKSSPGKGGPVENVFIENIYMKDIVDEAVTLDMTYEDKAVGKARQEREDNKIPRFSNLSFNNIYCSGADKALFFDGGDEGIVKNIKISNSVFSAKYGFEAVSVKLFELDNVKISPAKGPVFKLDKCGDFTIRQSSNSQETAVFMKVSGESSKNIVIENSDLSKYKTRVEYAPETDNKSVIFK